MLTCFIRYHIDPCKRAQFEQYARNWGEAIPRNGADLVGYFAPHEGSATLAYGVYHVESLAAYEAYRLRLQDDPLGRENYEFAMREKFLLREDRTFLTLVSSPHGGLIKPIRSHDGEVK
ncbi:NIPSNAP family protein [Cohaesibacter celericrescens]|uniref:NIPSNAP family protein n=1 Tax=Cohaesibacter celericrescens TaxID=2067669 RepID=A0A2N5XKW6_9HYPH|nr:NIPSNAP family protein [Cohaesibacter celericrescens]PLW75088.1 NIPSNAP family protein [Cohaesibacter celericrescens]